MPLRRENPESRDIAEEAMQLSQGVHLPGVSTIKGGYRRVSTLWLREVRDHIRSLEYQLQESRSVLRKIVAVWEDVPFDTYWAQARHALRDFRPRRRTK